MWPFKKKSTQSEQPIYLFIPNEDITAAECAQFLAGIAGGFPIDAEYVCALPEPMRRHFKPVQTDTASRA